MSKTNTTSRRSFLKSGAIAAAPIAAVGVPAAALANDGSKAKLARLEDERAILELHAALLRRVNTAGLATSGEFFASGKAPSLGKGLRSIAPDPTGESPALTFSEDGGRATQSQAVRVGIAAELEGEGTLVQMARLQGNALEAEVLPRTLVADYVREEGGWAIEKLRLA
jgi:hypothetical protein